MVQRLVQSRHPFVFLRGNTYYFRYALPLHLRKLCPSLPAEVKRSLHTDSYSEAVSMVTQKIPIIKTLKRCQDVSAVEALCSRLVDFSEQVKAWVDTQLERLSRAVRGAEPAVVPMPKPKRKKSLTLLKAWEAFVEWKSWNEKRARDNQRVFDNLLFFLGDVPVDQITKSDIKSALASISELPVRIKKPYRDMSLDKLVEMDIPESDLVAGKYVKEHLKLAQGLFNSYLVRERDLLLVSPTDGIRWEHEDRRYASLTDAQVRSVLKRSESKPEWFRWFLMIAVYSGARRSEIASLRPCDFKLCPDTHRHYFVIQDGKTKAARRMVPVHPSLIDAGLLKWIGQGRKLIFPLPASNPNQATHNFSSLVDERINDLGEKIVFHSTRHTFITKTRAAGITNVLVQQVVGHEKSGAGQTDRYTHTFQLKDVLAVVDAVDYGG